MADTIETAVYRLKYEGLDQAYQAAAALGTVTVAEEGQDRASRSAIASFERRMARLDPMIAAYQRYQKVLEQVARDEAAGIGSAQQRNYMIELATRKYAEAAGAIEKVAAAQEHLNRAQAGSVTAAQVNQNLGVRDDFGGAQRAQDVAIYGKELDNLRAKYSPLFAAQQQYKATLAEINMAQRVGAISEKERAEAVMNTKVAFVQQVNSLRGVRDSLDEASGAQQKFGAASGLARHELINLSRQAQDIGVSLASGQSPFTVLVQQGTQVADVFASSSGTMRGFFGQMWTGAVRVMGSIGGIVAGVAAIGATALIAAAQWASAQREIERGLFGAGRASGVTGFDINAIAGRQASAFGLSISEARQFATVLAATGAVGKQNLEPLVAIGKNIANVYGVDATDAAQLLAKAMMDPAKGAIELNQRLGNIDASTVRQIANLQAQNRLYEAQALLVEKARAGSEGIGQTIASSTHFWTALGNAVSNLWDAIGAKIARFTGIGLVRGLEEQIADGERRVAELERRAADAGNTLMGRARAGSGQESGTDAALRRERAELEKNRQALADYREEMDRAQSMRRSFAAEGAVRDVLPEIGEREKLRNSYVLLNLAMMQVNATGGEASPKLAEMGVSYKQLGDAVETARSRVANFKTEFQRALEQQDIAIRSVTAYSAAQRGQIAYETAVNQALAQGYNLTRAYVLGIKARQLAETQAREQLRESARERELAARQTVQSAQVEIDAIGKGIGEQYRLRTELQARQQLEQEAARNRTAFDQAHFERLQKQIALTAQLKQVEAERSLADNLAFDRAQLARSDIEQKVAQQLRSLYGNDYVKAMDGAIAQQIRFNETLKQTIELQAQWVNGFLADLRAGKSPLDALINQMTRLGDTFVNAGAKQFMSAMNTGGFGGFDLSTFSKGVQKGVSGGLADFARSAAGEGAGGAAGGAGFGVGAGLAGLGIMASAYSTGYGTNNPLLGAAGGALTGAMGGFAVGGPIGAAIGGVVGALMGLFGASQRAADELKKAKEEWEKASVRFRVFNETLSGNAPGQLGNALNTAEDQMKQFIEAAKKAQDFGAVAQVEKNFETYKARLINQFKSLFDDTLEAYRQGLGANSPFLQAAQNVQSLGESIKAFVADTQRAYGSYQTVLLGGLIGQSISGGVRGSEQVLVGGEEQAAAARKAGQDYLLALLAGVEPLTDVTSKLMSLSGMAAQLHVTLVELGMSAAEADKAIREKLAVALGKLRDDFIDSITRKINEATGKGFFNEIADLIKERDSMIADAQKLGVDPTLIGRYFQVQAQKIIDSSGLVGEAFEALIKQFPELKGVVTESTKALEESIEAQKQQILDAQNFLSGIARNITEWLNNLKGGSQSPLAPKDRLASAQQDFMRQLALAQGGDRTALSGITRFADTYLEAARSMFASSDQYQAIFKFVSEAMKNLPAQVTPEELVKNSIDEMKKALVAAIGLNSPALISAALLPMFNTLDTTMDGALDFEEFKEGLGGIADDKTLRDIFDNLDLNKDGIISKLELVQGVLKSAIDSGNAGAIATALSTYFNTLDTTMDGALTFDELKEGLGGIADDKTLRDIFDNLDANKDGIISKLELVRSSLKDAIDAGNAGATAAALATFFDQLNTTVDKGLTLDELKAGLTGFDEGNLKRIFAELDGNGDGILEKSELQKRATEALKSPLDQSADRLSSTINRLDQALGKLTELLTTGSTSNNLLTSINSLQSTAAQQLQLLRDNFTQRNYSIPIEFSVTGQVTKWATFNNDALQALNKIAFNTAQITLNTADLVAMTNRAGQTATPRGSVAVYGAGGWIGGDLHSFGGTMINAERGEFIVNRYAAEALRPFMDDINRGRLPVIPARMPTNDNSELVSEIRALRTEVARLLETNNRVTIAAGNAVCTAVATQGEDTADGLAALARETRLAAEKKRNAA